MPPRSPEESLAAIEQAVAKHPDGASLSDVAEVLPERLADRTLQYRLKYLVDKGRLITDGEGRRWTRYRVPAAEARDFFDGSLRKFPRQRGTVHWLQSGRGLQVQLAAGGAKQQQSGSNPVSSSQAGAVAQNWLQHKYDGTARIRLQCTGCDLASSLV
ncbi:MAG: hypothetical protein WA830_14290 [Candidatus Sulfotelmatobacter sp.]